MLEDHPILRGRLLGLGAIAAILIGGAASVDFMLTSGLQFGDGASAATPAQAPQYFDDIRQDWNNPSLPARQVNFASLQSTNGPTDVTANAEGLDGAGASGGAPTSPTVAPVASPTPETIMEAQHDDSEQRYAAIEADIQQAPQGEDGPSKDASESASPW
jgi:hypothetical protein